MLKKYNVSIEQPMCKTWEIEAESLEQAEEIATEKYNNEEFIITNDDLGTDAQIQVEAQDESESTDWHDMG